ncbi:NAD(+) synthase [Myxococcota bacterium]|jgi:NAD+ synthase|nr:NAD(+) synthase [Myxococcota bacterium]
MTDRPLAAALELDLEAEADRIAARLREALTRDLRKRGLVVAVSGGIDSSCCAALAVRAVGPERVFALLLPERESSPDSTARGRILCEHLGVESLVTDIAPTLEAIGCYRWRDEALAATFPGYGPGWKQKIVIAGGLEGRFNYFNAVAESPDGERFTRRLGHREYLQIVAATNFKQRVRKTLEFFHADRLNYAVVGTPNRLEYALGFFVRNGDGSADVKPIAHLYKTQVYALARHLGLPETLCSAVPTTDTYSLAQGQDEFYFALPYPQMDVALYAHTHGRPAAELAAHLGIEVAQAEHVYRDIDAKIRATAVLAAPPLLVGG